MQIQVVLQARRPLSVGDVLLCLRETGNEVVELGIVDAAAPADASDDIDLLVSPQIGARLGLAPDRRGEFAIGRAELSAVRSVQERSLGRLSLISSMPLGSGLRTPQPFGASHMKWLLERGLLGLAAEFCSLKSDGSDTREELTRCFNREQSGETDVMYPLPGRPESLRRLTAHLGALGFHVTLGNSNGRVALSLRPATDAERRGISAGIVRKSETVHYQTLLPQPEGLFCPELFSQRRQFGRIELSAPVVSLVWRWGRPSMLSRATGLEEKVLTQVVAGKRSIELGGDGFNVLSAAASKSREDGNCQTGATAIREILQRFPARDLPLGLPDPAAQLVAETLLVLPAEERPLVRLESGQFATSDLNDLYRRVINRNNRLAKLRELRAPSKILQAERIALQEEFDAFTANVLLPGDRQVGEARPLKDCLAMTLAIASTEDPKRVEFSARARLLRDPDLPDETIRIPTCVWSGLLLREDRPVLLTSIQRNNPSFIAGWPRNCEGFAIRVSPAVYARLVSEDADRVTECMLHRPLTTPAVAEAQELVGRDLPATALLPLQSAGWLGCGESKPLAEQLGSLIDDALEERVIACDSAEACLIAGVRPVTDPPESAGGPRPSRRPVKPPGLVLIDPDVRQVPIPVNVHPLDGEELSRHLLELIERHKRPVCRYSIEIARSTPSITEARLGGKPFLPPDFRWPVWRGRTLEFLAQVPLDHWPRGLQCPIADHAGKLLTVFWCEGLWEIPSGENNHTFFVVPLDGSVARPHPEGVAEHPACRLTPEWSVEIPIWEELEDRLRQEFGPTLNRDLVRFKSEQWPQFSDAAASPALKLAGWPHWIQGADTERQLLFQLPAIEEAQIGFYDAGTMFVFGDLSGMIQYY